MRIKLRDADEVAHVWASRSQAEGRCANMFFDGARLYSYGRHFELGRFDDEKNVVLLSTRDYSPTTSKHKWKARGAVSHKNIIYVHNSADLENSAQVALMDIERLRVAAVKARSTAADKRAQLEGFIARTAEWVALYSKEVDAATRRKINAWEKRRIAGTLFNPKEVAKIKAAVAADNAEARKTRQQREEEARRRAEEKRAKALKDLEQWAAGDLEHFYASWDIKLPTRLRLKDGRVETSRGAQITERKARELWAGLVRGADVAGVELDHYTVTSWNGAVLRVGCHNIPRAEIENMARALGLPGVLPPLPDPVGMGWDETMSRPDAGGI